ncbi:uncharacterized protein PGTG_03755 [Puccinia graminis f. sp. tritici CRL 75-36-700-3]|uniref:Uncharacterized protein n=1 Tax=Puccinia graminis f. sp. tritici (strain CRL 75-36-700-3 / race SCCL) TaxID=418459 RepID=E3K0H4_PUCGT|nr:uncharacterized protein PGTG_03755 [Puccinia graminis f. sp. tritici CRL 75-36-700-3]EFP77799.1 hypothetical protein PGTG_03755 [Puccinia graminis f. sp. tritici CRL 75-36-700-3]
MASKFQSSIKPSLEFPGEMGFPFSVGRESPFKDSVDAGFTLRTGCLGRNAELSNCCSGGVITGSVVRKYQSVEDGKEPLLGAGIGSEVQMSGYSNCCVGMLRYDNVIDTSRFVKESFSFGGH